MNLLNGDCIDLLRAIPDSSVDLILTDPPYAMTKCKWDLPFDLSLWWKEIKRVRKENSAILIFGKQPFTTKINQSNIDEFRYEIIWIKQQATNPMCAYKRIMPIHENISVFYKKQCIYNPQMSYNGKKYKSFFNDKEIGEIYGLKSKHRDCSDGSRFPTTALYYNNVRGGLHPTEKPIAMLEYLIKTFTNERDIVLDPFMGSGSSGVASVNTNREFIGIEKEEKYFQISNGRIQESYAKQNITF